MTEGNQQHITGSIEELNQPLRARVDAVEDANRRALSKAEQERRESLRALRKALIERITASDQFLDQKLENFKELLQQEIAGNKALVEQYHIQQEQALLQANQERESSAIVLRNEQQRAADVLSEQFNKWIEAGDDRVAEQAHSNYEQLKQHIEHQRQQVDLSFAASQEAISKAEVATEKRFEQIQKALDETRQREERFLPREFRELVDANILELREGRATNAELIHQLTLRLTQFEARGGGEKDHAADLKSTLAIGISAVVGVSAIVISLITLLGGP